MMIKSIPQPIRILMVEDDPADVRLTREALINKKVPLIMHDVPDGIEAMAFLRKEGAYTDMVRPDLILLDLNMPRMDGPELIENVRERYTKKQMAILGLFSSQDHVASTELISAGADDFLAVPFYDEEFYFRITRLIEFVE